MNTVIHFEFPSTDLTITKDFYSNLFGWKMETFDKNYLVVELANEESGGFYKVDKIVESQKTIYFAVEDITKTIARAVQLGGVEIESKRSIGEHGFIGSFADPLGLCIDIWSKD